MTERKYLPTLAELIDRLSIVQLKAIFIQDNRRAYNDEMELIKNDITILLEEQFNKFGKALTAEAVHAVHKTPVLYR